MEAGNHFIAKQSNGELWYFFYETTRGIIGINFYNNKIKNNLVAAEDAIDNFTVYINSKDEINIFYEDLSGNICLAALKDDGFKSNILFSRKSNNHEKVYFQVIMEANNIYLFYSISNNQEKEGTLVCQIFNGYEGWSKPNFIDKVFILKNKSFTILKHDHSIFILYVKYDTKFTLGYKIFQGQTKKCSERTVIDYNDFPFLDYEMLIINNSLHGLYIKSEGNFSSLIYTRDNKAEVSRQLFINSCAIFSVDNEIYLCWSEDKKFNYINLSQKSKIKSLISPSSLTKAMFLSNYADKNLVNTNSIYIYVENYIPVAVMANLYLFMDGASDDKYALLLKKFQQKKFELIKASSDITLKSSEISNLQSEISNLKQEIAQKNAEINMLNSKLQQMDLDFQKSSHGLFNFFKK